MSSPAPPRAGRPKDTAKHAAILTAATNLFARQPYDLVKMEDVAALAGVSKMTIYSHFQDKEALFESIVRTVSDAMIAALSDPDPGGDDPAERLVAVGRAFLGVILGPQIAVLCHTLPGALRTNRDLGPRFYDAGPGRAHAVLAGIIAAELTVDDPQQAAADLLSLWQGDIGARIAFGVAETLSPADIDRRARRGTALFLKIHKKEAVVF